MTEIFFFKNHTQNEAGKLNPDLFCFSKMLYLYGKSKWSVAYFQYISTALNLAHNKNKLYKTLDY